MSLTFWFDKKPYVGRTTRYNLGYKTKKQHHTMQKAPSLQPLHTQVCNGCKEGATFKR